MRRTRDIVTLTSQPRHSVTSSQTRDSYVIATRTDEHLTTVHGEHSNSSHGNVVHATSVLPHVLPTTFGDHVTTLPDVTSSSTGNDVKETPRSGLSSNYSSERVTVVAVVCVCAIVLTVALVIVATILVRYVDSFRQCSDISVRNALTNSPRLLLSIAQPPVETNPRTTV